MAVRMLTRHLQGYSATGYHKLSYLEFLPAAAKPKSVVMCVHGLLRNCHDFDVLANALAEDGHRVVCLDVVGRGKSGWLPTSEGYSYPQYLSDLAVLMSRVLDDPTTEKVNYVGTSMGGLMGLMTAVMPNNNIKSMVLNDIGPFVHKEPLESIAAYSKLDPTFYSFEEVVNVMKERYGGYGDLSEEQWKSLAEHSSRTEVVSEGEGEGGEGKKVWKLHHDPKIGKVFETAAINDVDLWAMWDLIRVPVLCMRGEVSTILSRETAKEMTERGPKAKVVEVKGAGHAPGLMSEWEVKHVVDFINEQQ
mmetsp:Transcript_31555/g.82396  ORF Transcript_31555/g.82396 Transcript_31555/m.82396 type:complete len:305 (-) Transcript_31555:235-1149(-)